MVPGVTIDKFRTKQVKNGTGIPETGAHNTGTQGFFYCMGKLNQLDNILFITGSHDDFYDIPELPEVPLQYTQFVKGEHPRFMM